MRPTHVLAQLLKTSAEGFQAGAMDAAAPAQVAKKPTGMAAIADIAAEGRANDAKLGVRTNTQTAGR